MKIKIGLILIGAVAGATSLLANTATLDITSNPGGVISPYYGTYTNTNGTTNVTLYCDDPTDEGYLNKPYSVNAASNGGGISLSVAATPSTATSGRFASLDAATSDNTSWYTTSSNGTGGALHLPTTSTNLYDELAWLFSQISDTVSGESSTTLNTNIQDAAWALTSKTDSESQETTGAAEWINLAYTAVVTDGNVDPTGATTVGGATVTLQSVNLNDWFVIDAATDGGSTDSAGTTWQEYLSYSSGGSGLGGGGSATPEPATFGLLGSALLFGGLFLRRRSAK